MELGGARNMARGDSGGGDESLGGFGSFNTKDMKKEQKYVNYAFMVLLGMITWPSARSNKKIVKMF